MKRTHSVNPDMTGRWLTVCSSAVISIFLLQSCCLLPGAQEGARRPCNCPDKKQEYAANKNTGQTTDAVRTPVISSTKVPVGFVPKSAGIGQATDTYGEPQQVQSQAGDQKKTAKKLPLGIKGIGTQIIAGPSVSFKSSDEDYGSLDHKNKGGIGFQFGVKSTYTFSDKLDVSTGLLLKQNNASEVIRYSSPGEPGGGSSSQEYESKYSFTYLSAPVMAEVKVSDQLTLMAGPEFNVLLAASVKESGYGSSSEKTDIKDNSVKTGIGVQAGIKYTIPNSPLALQLIYDQRLSRLNEKNEEYYPGSSYESPAWHMKSIQLGVTCAICSLLKGKK